MTGCARRQDQPLGRGEIRISRDRFTGNLDYERGPGVSDQRFHGVRDGRKPVDLPTVQERPGGSPPYEAPNVVHDAADGGSPGHIDRALQGPSVEGPEAWRPPTEPGGGAPGAAATSGVVDLARNRLQSEVPVRIEGLGPDGRPRFNQDDLYNLSRIKYPDIRSRDAMSLVEEELTGRFGQQVDAATGGGDAPPWNWREGGTAGAPSRYTPEQMDAFVRRRRWELAIQRGEQLDLTGRPLHSANAWDFTKANMDRGIRRSLAQGQGHAGTELRPPADVDVEAQRPAWVEQYIHERREFSWLDGTDRTIRETWRATGAGRDPQSVQRFHDRLQQQIQAGQLDRNHVDGWFEMERVLQTQRGQVRLPDSVRPPEVAQTIENIKRDNLPLGQRMDRFDTELRSQWQQRGIDDVSSLDPAHAQRRRQFFDYLEQRASQDPKFAHDLDDWLKYVVRTERPEYTGYDPRALPPTGG